jgi:two-component system, sensor histidine kinase and response regulator
VAEPTAPSESRLTATDAAQTAGASAPSVFPASLSGTPMDFGGARILLAEDNDINVQLFCAMLEDLGLHIEVARDGAAALDLLRQNAYALAFIDIQMPVMDGLHLTRALRRLEREDPARPRVPVVALTANAYASDLRDSLAAGCDLHLSKPYERRQLLQALVQWLTPIVPTQPGGVALPAPPGQQTRNAGGSSTAAALAPAPAAQPRPQSPNQTLTDSRAPLLDAAAAIARLGSLALYEKACAHAAPYFASWSAQFGSARALADRPQQLNLAHNLKSIAGAVGARALADSAAALEQRLQQEPSVDEAGELAAVLAALAAVSAQMGPSPGPGSGPG